MKDEKRGRVRRPIGILEWCDLTREMLLEVYPKDTFPRSEENAGSQVITVIERAVDEVIDLRSKAYK